MSRIQKLYELKAIIDGNINKANVNTLLQLNNYFIPNKQETCGCKSARIIQKLESFWNTTGNNEYIQSKENEEDKTIS